MNRTSELAAILGPEKVSAHGGLLRDYAGDHSPAPELRPSSVVEPSNLSQVQEIVRWANRTRTPLVPVSSASPHFHGDTVPGIGGAVIVDVSSMKRIIRVDRRNRVAMVEPGVTFGELIPACREQGLAPFLPLCPRAGKSVLTAFLERSPITMPKHHWEPQDPLQCLEVVYGNGDLMRTGSAAGPGGIEEQWKVGRAQLRGMGPSQADFTRLLQGAQGTMGIATWATLRCRPLPESKKALLAVSGELPPLIALAYALTYRKLGEELLIANRSQLCALLGKEPAGDGSLPEWFLYLSIEASGLFPEDKLAYQEKASLDCAREAGLSLCGEISGISAGEVSDVLAGPSPEPYWKLAWAGSCRSVFFLTSMDKSPGFAAEMKKRAEDCGYPAQKLCAYLQPLVQGSNCHLEFSLPFEPEDARESRAAERLAREGARAMARMGGFFSRPHGDWNDFAYDRRGMHVAGLRKLKALFDPKGIMNPGKLCF